MKEINNMKNQIIIKEFIKQESPHRNLFSLFFAVEDGNDYITILEEEDNVFKIFGGIGLANGETEKNLLRQLERYASLNDENKCMEINNILDEWEEIVGNLDVLEKIVNDNAKRHSL